MIIISHSVKNFQMVKNEATAFLSIQDIFGTIRTAAHLSLPNLFMLYLSLTAIS